MCVCVWHFTSSVTHFKHSNVSNYTMRKSVVHKREHDTLFQAFVEQQRCEHYFAPPAARFCCYPQQEIICAHTAAGSHTLTLSEACSLASLAFLERRDCGSELVFTPLEDVKEGLHRSYRVLTPLVTHKLLIRWATCPTVVHSHSDWTWQEVEVDVTHSHFCG